MQTLIRFAILAMFLILMGSNAEAKVLLLTSFERASEERVVERSFRQRMRPARGQAATEIEVRHKATQWELYQALQDHTLEGVFWVSHGQSAPAAMGGMVVPKLLDHRGDNVAPIFALASPGLNFVGAIGCNLSSILEQSRVLDNLRRRSYVSSDARASATREIERAVRAFRALGPATTYQPPQTITGLERGHLRVLRFVPADADVSRLRALRVIVGERLVGLMPAPTPGAWAQYRVAIPPTVESLDVKLETGENPLATNLGAWGDVRVDSRDLGGTWEMFTGPEGEPLGVNHRLFFHAP